MADNIRKQQLGVLVRRTRQTRGGFIPLDALTETPGGEEALECRSGISRMMLSQVVTNIAAFALIGRQASLLPLLTRAKEAIRRSPKADEAKEMYRLERLLRRIDAGPVSDDGIRAWCEMTTYAPAVMGGHIAYPDGGYTVPEGEDIALIRRLAHRSAIYLANSAESDLDLVRFRFEPDLGEADAVISSAEVEFAFDSHVARIMPIVGDPQPRDVLLVAMWAMLCETDAFEIYNPYTGALYRGDLDDMGEDLLDEIWTSVLTSR